MTAINKFQGRVQLTIGRFAAFANNVVVSNKLGEPLTLNGLPWRLKVIPYDRDTKRTASQGKKENNLGVFLQCDGDPKNPGWSCVARATIRLIKKRGGGGKEKDLTREIEHRFHKEESDWGYGSFITIKVDRNFRSI